VNNCKDTDHKRSYKPCAEQLHDVPCIQLKRTRKSMPNFTGIRVFKFLVTILHIIHINPLHAKSNPICHLLALLGAHSILHVSRVRVNVNKHGSTCSVMTATQRLSMYILPSTTQLLSVPNRWR